MCVLLRQSVQEPGEGFDVDNCDDDYDYPGDDEDEEECSKYSIYTYSL